MKTRDSATVGLDDARRLRAAVETLVRRFSISERADVACCGTTVAQAATLGVLRRTGPMRLGPLGRALGIAPSTLTRNVDRLEERALVRREPDPTDARAARVALTAAGEAAAGEVERQEDAFARAILEGIPEGERDTVVRGLESLLAAVRRATEACCPGAYDHLVEIRECGDRPAREGDRDEQR